MRGGGALPALCLSISDTSHHPSTYEARNLLGWRVLENDRTTGHLEVLPALLRDGVRHGDAIEIARIQERPGDSARFGRQDTWGGTVGMVNPLVEYMRTTTRLERDATEFLWRDADSLVTFTAPHNKAVLRDGAYKKRDNNVGVLALEAAKIAGANVLLPLTPGDVDGNWHGTSRFRSALLALVPAHGVVIDVHGMHDDHGFDVIVGTCGGRTPSWLSDIVSGVFGSRGFTLDVRDTGKLSAGPNTVTGAMLDAGHTAVQIEVARRWRDGRNSPSMLTVTIETLAEVGSQAKRYRSST
jgi:hypothetical protein